MPRHHEQPPEGRGMQGVGDEPFTDRHGGVQHQRHVAGRQHLAAEQPRQAHVAEGACHEGDGQDGQLRPQEAGEHAAPSAGLAAGGRDQQGLGTDGERQDADPQEHLHKEDPSLQYGDDGVGLADAVDQEECRQRVDRGTHGRWGQPPHDQHSREQDRDPHGVHDHARRVGIDPDGADQSEHQRRRHRRRQDQRRRRLARLLVVQTLRSGSRQAGEYQGNEEDRELKRQAGELASEEPPCQVEMIGERLAQARACVRRNQHPGLRAPDGHAVPGERLRDQRRRALGNPGQGVIAQADLLDQPILKPQDQGALLPDAPSSRGQRGQRVVDPLDHACRGLGGHRPIAGRGPRDAHGLDLLQLSFEHPGAPCEDVALYRQLRASHPPGIGQRGECAGRWRRRQRPHRPDPPPWDVLADGGKPRPDGLDLRTRHQLLGPPSQEGRHILGPLGDLRNRDRRDRGRGRRRALGGRLSAHRRRRPASQDVRCAGEHDGHESTTDAPGPRAGARHGAMERSGHFSSHRAALPDVRGVDVVWRGVSQANSPV